MRFALRTYIDEMRTFVLLAAFLLAASATPIQNSFSGTSVEDTVETDQERVPPSLPGDISAPASDHQTAQDGTTVDEDNNGDRTVTSISTVSDSAESEVPDQATNSSIGPPADADPEDCRNASKPNHVYLLCSYSCEGDEMFMAVNNSKCYLNPPNDTAKFPISVLYNSMEHHDNNTGVCMEGQCVGKPTEAPTGPTESSPTQSTAANTDRETESTRNDQASVVTAQPSTVTQFFPERPQTEDTPTQNNTGPENPVLDYVQGEGKEATPQVSSGPAASPDTLPAVD